MTTAFAEPAIETPGQVELDHASWELYEMLLRELGGQNIRITYDRGRLVFMSPILPEHETPKTLIGAMIELLSMELNIPIAALGSTTFKRKDLQRGLEPDECYYIQHESRMRGKKRVNLKRDPPPDLVVEVDVTHHPIDRAGIYAALGVPEMWRFDGGHLSAYRLGKDGQYRVAEKSVAFPFLRPAELERFLAMQPTAGQTAMMRAFRDWVREELTD